MKQTFTFLIAVFSFLWSSSAFAIDSTRNVLIVGNIAKSTSFVTRPASEEDTYDEVRCFASIFEENQLVTTDYDNEKKVPGFPTPIACLATAVDTNLSVSCSYCNDETLPSSPGASWGSGGHWLLPAIQTGYWETWNRNTWVNGVTCRVYLGGGGWIP